MHWLRRRCLGTKDTPFSPGPQVLLALLLKGQIVSFMCRQLWGIAESGILPRVWESPSPAGVSSSIHDQLRGMLCVPHMFLPPLFHGGLSLPGHYCQQWPKWIMIRERAGKTTKVTKTVMSDGLNHPNNNWLFEIPTEMKTGWASFWEHSGQPYIA